MKILILSVLLCNLFNLIFASKLYVLLKPPYLNAKFDEESSIKESEFVNLLGAVYGLGKSDSEFKGIQSTNPLKYPKVQIVLLYDEESDSFGSSFDVEKDTEIDFKSLANNFNNDRFKVSYEYFDSISNAESSLKDSHLKCKDNRGLVYVVRVNDKSEPIDKLVDRLLNILYNNCNSKMEQYLVYLLATPSPLPLSRSVRQANPTETKNITNPADFYNQTYPAAFNIIFWTSLVIALAALGGACLIGNMDPGTDTVIYRMTSQRIKKDQ